MKEQAEISRCSRANILDSNSDKEGSPQAENFS